jgi:acyl carrier protein
MVPSAFVFLDELPLNAHGKLDRRALPAPERARPGGRPYRPPRNEAEEAIAAVWRELLGIDRVGAHDNFFELGGHSLLALQLTTRLREILHVEVRVQDVFEAPTVSELAAVLDGSSAVADDVAKLESALQRVESMPEADVKALLRDPGQDSEHASTR